ncbi:MAG: LON peptidase substrate-binding domain-containing protein [Cytophagales bacterium]|nr:LON peptidase substrate-binding domain-containing protein [Armatimonadota bacterium]
MDNPVNPDPENDPEAALVPSTPLTELPLFPLDLVLFPQMILPLHIFEERYKEMVNHCVRESLPFGIVLATGAAPDTGRIETHDIGCTARILRVERLPDGKMNIEIIGENRFRILDTHESLPYRTGLIELLADLSADESAVVPLAGEVQRLLKDFLARSLALMGQNIGEFELPDEPEPLSFTAACVLPLENDEKQLLLEDTDTAARLSEEKEILMREVTRLRRAAETSPESEPGETEWHPVKADRYEDYLSAN